MRTLNEIAFDLELEVEAMEKSENAHWLRIGALLNEGRAQFPIGDNVRFSNWADKATNGKLPFVILGKELSAAMWAAANPEQLAEMQALGGKTNTIRGWHAKWLATKKVVEAEAEAQRLIAEQRQREQEEATKRLVIEIKTMTTKVENATTVLKKLIDDYDGFAKYGGVEWETLLAIVKAHCREVMRLKYAGNPVLQDNVVDLIDYKVL